MFDNTSHGHHQQLQNVTKWGERIFATQSHCKFEQNDVSGTSSQIYAVRALLLNHIAALFCIHSELSALN